MRVIPFAMIAFAALTGCAEAGPPSDVTNACAIVRERPQWFEAAEAAERKWGAPVAVTLAMIWRESKFVSEARPPRKRYLGVVPTSRLSSAYGFSQALDGTWDWYVSETGAEAADRTKFADSVDFVGWYMAQTHQRVGAHMTDAAAHYLAYHQGHAGFESGRWRESPNVQAAAASVAYMARRFNAQLARCVPGFADRHAPASAPNPALRPTSAPRLRPAGPADADSEG